MPVKHHDRHDLYTDAGRDPGDMFLIAANLASSVCYAMEHILQLQGWTVEIRPAEPRRLNG